MKHLYYVLLLAILFTSCQQQKIGYVDNGTLINDFQEKKDLEAKFEIKEKAFAQKYDSIDQSFQLEVQKFQLAANKMSKKKAQERYQQLGQQKQINDQQKQVEAQQFRQAFQNEIDTLIVKVKDFVSDYGKTNQYDFILGTSEGAASVLYGKEETDLTKTILEALNADYAKE